MIFSIFLSTQGANLSSLQYDTLAKKLKSLQWDWPSAVGDGSEASGSGGGGSKRSPLALRDGDPGCNDEVWAHVKDIIEKMEVVDKVVSSL